MAAATSTRFSIGAANAGTTFFLDGTVNMFILAALLVGTFSFPTDIVFGRIIPGAAVAIFAGNMLIGWDARRRAKETGRNNMTSIPIGLDIATTFLMVFLVLGPIYTANVDALGPVDAAHKAWKIGMAVTLWIGVGKVALSVLGPSVQRILPNSAVLGTLTGVALTWLGAEPLLGILQTPEVGLFALGIIIFALMAGHRLPGNLPGAFIAVFVGTITFLIIAKLGISPSYTWPESKPASVTLPYFSLGGISETFNGGAKYFGIVIPLTLFSALSAVNIVRSAKLIGDDFDTRRIMIIDGIATIISALSGGVVQTVTYLGHTTYKRMGATTGYAIGAAIIILLLTLLGLIEFAATYIPNAVLKGILIVVATDIVRISLSAVKSEEAPAFLFAIVPAFFAYAFSKLEQFYNASNTAIADLGGTMTEVISADIIAGYDLLGILSRGAILTALLLASMVAWIVTKKFRRAAMAALLCAVFTSFGLIHSVVPTSEIYLPWAVPDMGGAENWTLRLSLGYFILAVTLITLSFIPQDKNAMSELTVTDGGFD